MTEPLEDAEKTQIAALSNAELLVLLDQIVESARDHDLPLVEYLAVVSQCVRTRLLGET